MAQARARHRAAPRCDICSYRQLPPAPPDWSVTGPGDQNPARSWIRGAEPPLHVPYLCHPARPVDDLNVLVSASNLHDIHHPRDDRVRCPPDPIHIEWLTVCGATIADLQYAWELDYSKSNRPMRILRVLPLPMGLYWWTGATGGGSCCWWPGQGGDVHVGFHGVCFGEILLCIG